MSDKIKDTQSAGISNDLLDVLVCPKCKGKVALNDYDISGDSANKEYSLLCVTCNLEYSISDSIPVMLINEAKPFK